MPDLRNLSPQKRQYMLLLSFLGNLLLCLTLSSCDYVHIALFPSQPAQTTPINAKSEKAGGQRAPGFSALDHRVEKCWSTG